MRTLRNIAFVLLIAVLVVKWRVGGQAQNTCTATRDLGCQAPCGPGSFPPYSPTSICQEQCCINPSTASYWSERCFQDNGCGVQSWRAMVEIPCAGSCGGGGGGGGRGGGGGGGGVCSYTHCIVDSDCCELAICDYGYYCTC